MLKKLSAPNGTTLALGVPEGLGRLALPLSTYESVIDCESWGVALASETVPDRSADTEGDTCNVSVSSSWLVDIVPSSLAENDFDSVIVAEAVRPSLRLSEMVPLAVGNRSTVTVACTVSVEEAASLSDKVDQYDGVRVPQLPDTEASSLTLRVTVSVTDSEMVAVPDWVAFRGVFVGPLLPVLVALGNRLSVPEAMSIVVVMEPVTFSAVIDT
jgi:hypothetical protein